MTTAAPMRTTLNQHAKYPQRPWTDADEVEQEKVWADRSMPKVPASVSSTVAATPFAAGVLLLTPAATLYEADDVHIDYLWELYVAPSSRSLLSAPPKGGKTTLLRHLIANMANGGGYLAGRIEKAKILVLTEEPKKLWCLSCKALGIRDNVDFVFRQNVLGLPWATVATELGHAALKHGHDLVIVDTITYFAGIENENDAAQVTAAMKLLDAVTDLGKAVLLTHHKRKADGSHGAAVRGSGAFAGCVDVILELDRVKGLPRRRRLTCLSRLDEVPPATIELSADGQSYKAVGDSLAARRAIIDALLRESPGLTQKEILDSWPDAEAALKPGRDTLKLDLASGTQEGRYRTEGTGKGPGAAYRYFLNGEIPNPRGSRPVHQLSIAEREGNGDGGDNKGGATIHQLDHATTAEAGNAILEKHRGASATAVGVRAEMPRRRR